MYRNGLWDDASQGDVFSNFPISDYTFSNGSRAVFGPVRIGPVVLLSNDCDFDNRKFVLVAELLPLNQAVGVDHRDIVRQYQSRRLFYYSQLKDVLPESCIDFCRIHRVDKRFIVDCSDSHVRIASITEDARLALRRRIGLFFGLSEERQEQQ